MAGVRLDEVTKTFGGVVAVDGFSLDVADGEFLVLLGPSGCGKSTVLRMIAGLEEPTTGSIGIGDRSVVGLEPKERDVAMVFQSYALYPHKSVRQNIEFPLRPRHLSADERERLVTDAASQLGLDDLLDRKPRQLSGGQRQRVALARALVRRPEAFLMDEPLSNLDAKMRTQTRADLVELQQRLEATFIYVTHDQVEAMTMAERVAVMNEGRLQQLGPPQEVYDRPANVFVARFIGSPPMNTFAASLDHEDGSATARIGESLLELPDALAATARERGLSEAVVGVRPEHLAPGSEGIETKLRVVESLGHERLLVCELPGSGEPLVARRSAAEAAPDEGETVRFVADRDQLHLFDPATTRRIDP